MGKVYDFKLFRATGPVFYIITACHNTTMPCMPMRAHECVCVCVYLQYALAGFTFASAFYEIFTYSVGSGKCSAAGK